MRNYRSTSCVPKRVQDFEGTIPTEVINYDTTVYYSDSAMAVLGPDCNDFYLTDIFLYMDEETGEIHL